MSEAATLPGPAPATLPGTPVGRQLDWLCQAASRPPLSETELQAHVARPFLASGGFEAVLGRLAGASVESYRALPRSANHTAYALLDGPTHLKLSTDAAGRISALELTPVPTSWPELGDRLRALAPRTSFLAAEVFADRQVRPVYAIAPTSPRPIGSAIFLYVLGALAHAVDQGRAAWDEPLAVRDAWKADLRSPVGMVPDGAMLTLRQYADDAIFYSDSSAIDHLLGRLGRGAVEAQQVRFGHAQIGANLPFLTTREMAQLKVADYPRLGQGYVATDGPRAKLGYLREVVARLPRPAGDEWSVPRFADSVEWFASPTDVAKAFAGLGRQAASLPEVGDVLAQQGTAALGLDAGRWPVGWSMGGAEPGVVSENFLARSGGRTFVVSLMASDPHNPLDLSSTKAALLATAAGAFRLLAV